MDKKIIIAGVATLVIVLLLFFLLRTPDLPEEIIQQTTALENEWQQGALYASSITPLYNSLELALFYTHGTCNKILKRAVSDFPTVSINAVQKVSSDDPALSNVHALLQDKSIEFPLIIGEGSADILAKDGEVLYSYDVFRFVVDGMATCSEEIIQSILCEYMVDKPELCAGKSLTKLQTLKSKSKPADFVCYDQCFVIQDVAGTLVHQYWMGPPCAANSDYELGTSSVGRRLCADQTACEEDLDDIACCQGFQCSGNGQCYEPFDSFDIGNDGQKEVCVNFENKGTWVNPDSSLEACTGADFQWLRCVGDQCKGGIDNYDGKDNGLCCGDDDGEFFGQCTGAVCDNSSLERACCSKNSCVYGGACYGQGCHTLRLTNGEKKIVYCEGSNWVDLDEDHCEECIDKAAWSGLICCGDDEGEGDYPTRLVYNNDKVTTIDLYDQCTVKKNSCVLPDTAIEQEEGCYDFRSKPPFEGGYQCDESVWYDLDNSSKFCDDCGLVWLDQCCGDDFNEFVVNGQDGSRACCSSKTDIVEAGVCIPTVLCGDGDIDDLESCELPRTQNNDYCDQESTQCFGARTGTRDDAGYCNEYCQCQSDEFNLQCQKDSCGATCSSDIDCGDGEICDPEFCGCREKTYCGDGEVQGPNDEDWIEQCESPSSVFNPYCDDVLACFGTKTGVRYTFGSCSDNCQCIYQPYQQVCVKGSCDAECNQDGTGCGPGFTCDTATCGCAPTPSVCGNRLCESDELFACPQDCVSVNCPLRIDIEIEKDTYVHNETLRYGVMIYDRDNEPVANAAFDIDIVVNNKYIRTISHATSSEGTFERNDRIGPYLSSGSLEFVTFIAKTKPFQCLVTTDSDSMLQVVRGQVPKVENLSKFSFVYENDEFTERAICGNDLIEAGESCEGIGICRGSQGCDYTQRTYDLVEVCETCTCQIDRRGQPDDGTYCANCPGHCGDGVLNCGEDCETGFHNVGLFCRDGSLYDRIDACVSCQFADDGIDNDELVDECFCECPTNPGVCNNGDWVEYRLDYFSGCSDGSCNSCACEDTYTKDLDGDGIEDKCEIEICTNNIDDNDNGLIDMADPECSICTNCGIGSFNFCDSIECSELQEACFFEPSFLTFGTCMSCGTATCESYTSEEMCVQDACVFSTCDWKGTFCCTDSDADGICDSQDNCPFVPNVDQKNTDNDTHGDACETCIFEPLLTEPSEDLFEITCNDGIDNDCNMQLDCNDAACIGQQDQNGSYCCIIDSDCNDEMCLIETCTNNICETSGQRNICDGTDCPDGSFCDSEGVCISGDLDPSVCLSCSKSGTVYDEDLSFDNTSGLCCGNQDQEYLVATDEAVACCSSTTDCVNPDGSCTATGQKMVSGSVCNDGIGIACDLQNNNACLSVKNERYNQTASENENKNEYYCTFDGETWDYRLAMPLEVCFDTIDNDCDGLIDQRDPDC